ncbi:MAG: hypothetical protein EXR28_07260 [Betaproteobacteria bacterium]|nr:hypothetical protein [Betaproteobacteria bacterium]
MKLTPTPTLAFFKRSLTAIIPALVISCATLPPAKIIEPQELARGTVIISVPGHYRLGGDAVAGGLAANSPAIRIIASGVTLDLGGFTLSMPPGATGGNSGIEINGASNVTVTNGSLRDITGAGIFLLCDLDPAAGRCANFSFTRLDMRNVGKIGEYGDLGNIFNRPFSGGIVAFGRSTPVPVVGNAWENSINGLTVSVVTVRNDAGLKHLFSGSTPAGGQNGFSFASVSDLRVENTAISGMNSNDAAACIFLGRTKSVVVRRMECNGATGDRNANGLDSMANVFKPLAIKKNYDVLVEDSTFTNIRATGARGNEALGVELNGEKFTFDKLTITDIVNDSTTDAGNRAIGIQIVSNSESKELSRVSNCTVRNVMHHGNGRDSRAGGVSIESAPPILVRGCTVSNVSNLGTSTPSIKAFGYRVDPGANKVTFENNTSDNVMAPSVAKSPKPIPGYVAGFAFAGAQVEMNGNRSNRSLAGIHARKLAADSSIRDNRLECNRTGIDDDGGARPYARNRLTGNNAASTPASLLAGTDNNVSTTPCANN